VLGFLLLASALAEPLVADRVAAVVNHDVVTLSEIYDLGGDFIGGRCGASPDPARCVVTAEQEVLDALIKRTLVRQELSRLDMGVVGTDVDAAVESIVRDNQLPSRKALREEIERSGVSWENYREQLLEQLRLQRFQQAVLGPRVSITESELRERYDGMVGEVDGEQEVRLEAFGVLAPETEEDTLALMEKLGVVVAGVNSGELVWSEVVAENDAVGLASVIGGSAYRKGELASQVESVVFEAELNTVLEPILVGKVYFVLRVLSRGIGKGNVKSFDESKGDLQQAIFQQKITAVEEEWYQSSRRQSAIRILIGQE
jgi:hypothetical protein